MSKIHIGKRILEVLNKSHYTKVEFAKKINLTRDGVYKIFEKETIAADQLQKISKVLAHNFFSYYQNELDFVNEKTPTYGYASKEEVDNLGKLVIALAKRKYEKLRQELPKTKKGHRDAEEKRKIIPSHHWHTSTSPDRYQGDTISG